MVMVAESGTALSDGVVHAMCETMTEPEPRKSSWARRVLSSSTSVLEAAEALFS
jgi:hypothetical protein